MPNGLLEISFSGLFSSLVFGALGLWIFREGKKQLNFSVISIGLVLMIYPLFANGPLQEWGIGFALCALAYFLW